MSSFWSGFEKQALSPGLARRAQASAKLRLDAWNKLPLKEKLSDEGGKLFEKLWAKESRFRNYALKKELSSSHSAHMGRMKDSLQKVTEDHLKPLKKMLEKKSCDNLHGFWSGFEKRAARVPGVLSQGLATATKLPGQGVTSGLHSRGGLRQTSTTHHALPTDRMKMSPPPMKPAAIPTVGPMA